MNKAEFIRVKVTGRRPQFKELIGLSESSNTELLLAFTKQLHPNQDITTSEGKVEVFGAKHFVFRIYTNRILKTEVSTGVKTLFNL